MINGHCTRPSQSGWRSLIKIDLLNKIINVSIKIKYGLWSVFFARPAGLPVAPEGGDFCRARISGGRPIFLAVRSNFESAEKNGLLPDFKLAMVGRLFWPDKALWGAAKKIDFYRTLI